MPGEDSHLEMAYEDRFEMDPMFDPDIDDTELDELDAPWCDICDEHGHGAQNCPEGGYDE